MIKVAVSLVSTAVGLVLLLSFKSHTAGAPKSALAGTGSTPASTAGPGGAATHSPSPRRTKRPRGAHGTFTGDPIDTPYGTMQVAAVVSNGRLTGVTVLRHTDVGGRSAQIDAAALPVLKSEAMSAHGADIDVVSGATYTSRGYAGSLQSALDKAGI
ncbi:FMN-binding protein [Actinoallomurus iriomotensis]|uniref:FMN-binding protein n=1 Tax=Actinoallomurus iriomotensis TaxID=478107 RepID=A0A9W6RGR4_9ACTN|nr:FMN-binding protein [Actinoallomurus iriomotensis]GLY75453.1 FMN-binding protein [Actinoallomurus iriomotensis]